MQFCPSCCQRLWKCTVAWRVFSFSSWGFSQATNPHSGSADAELFLISPKRTTGRFLDRIQNTYPFFQVFFSWLLSWNADGFHISSHTTGNNNQPLHISACLLVAIYMFTGSRVLGELGSAPGALFVVTFSQSYLSLSLFSWAMGESFWCEENPFPFTFLREALPCHLILFP